MALGDSRVPVSPSPALGPRVPEPHTGSPSPSMTSSHRENDKRDPGSLLPRSQQSRGC